MRNILLKFYKEIIEKEYGYFVIDKEEKEELEDNEIERIVYGNTRHIAICSMMLQGFNQFTIAQISGHHTLDEQLGYSNHLESYGRTYTYTMAKHFQSRINLNKYNFESTKKSKMSILSKALSSDALSSYRKVDHGRCKSNNFPFECVVDDCLFCDHFIANDDISQIMLDEKLKILDKEIKSKLNYIKSVVSSATNTEFKFKEDANLKTATNSLNTLMKRKAIICGYKMKGGNFKNE